MNCVLGITFGQVIPEFYAYIHSLYPGALFLAPLCGFGCLVAFSVSVSRFFASVNLLSLFNCFVGLFLGVLSVLQQDFSWWEGLSIPIVFLLVKVLSAWSVNHYIAHLEYARDIFKSRCDYIVTRDAISHHKTVWNEVWEI